MTLDRFHDLPADLAEIADSLPSSDVPGSFAQLRNVMALLPPPLGTTPVGGGYVQDPGTPDSAASEVAQPITGQGGAVSGGTGSTPGSNIIPGTIHTTTFASTIRPPIVWTGTLPTLPDTRFPEGSLIFRTNDGKLYRNVAGAWSVAVDGADIIANSITAGQIAAGAIGADEIAAGAVTIGKLFDTPLNLVGANGGFELDGDTAAGDPITGWTPDSGDESQWQTAAILHSGAYGLRSVQKSVPEAVRIKSALAPVIGGARHVFRGWVRGNAANSAGAAGLIRSSWFDKTGALITSGATTQVVGTSATWVMVETVRTAPADAVFVQVTLENTAASANGDIVYFDDIEASRVDGDVSHAGGDVVINSGGITITNGKFSMQDEFGKSSILASGFAGSWADFVNLGLYNGRFIDGDVGTLAAGRTTNMPYWTLTYSSSSASLLSGGGVRASFTGLGSVTMVSDRVPVYGGSFVELSWVFAMARTAGTLGLNPTLYWYKSDGSASSTASTPMAGKTSTATLAKQPGPADATQVPDDAAFCKVQFLLEETVSHNVNNTVTLYSATLVRKQTTMPAATRFPDGAVQYVTPGSGTVNNYSITGLETVALVQMAPTAAITFTGFVAPVYGKRLIYVMNYSLYSMTLKDENASSTAANRFLTPNSVDFVVGPMGMVAIYYNDLNSRWLLLANAN